MFEKFTEYAIKVVMLAQEESLRNRRNYVATEQILLGLIGERCGIAGKALRASGITLIDARREAEKFVDVESATYCAEIKFSDSTKSLFESARSIAHDRGVDFVASDHLLLALLAQKDGADHGVEILLGLGIDLANLERDTRKLGGSNANNHRERSIYYKKDFTAIKFEQMLKRISREIRYHKSLAVQNEQTDTASWLSDLESQLQKRIKLEDPDWQPLEPDRWSDAIQSALQNIENARDYAVRQQNFDAAAKLREIENNIIREMNLTFPDE